MTTSRRWRRACGHPAPASPDAGLEVDLVGEGLQIAQLGIADEDDVAAAAPVAAVRARRGGRASPCEKKRSRSRRSRPPRGSLRDRRTWAAPRDGEPGRGLRCRALLGDYADDAPRLAGGEDHAAGSFGEQGVVGADAHVDAGTEPGAPLPHEDGAGLDGLAGERFDTQALSVGIAAVPGTAAAFLVSHSRSFLRDLLHFEARERRAETGLLAPAPLGLEPRDGDLGSPEVLDHVGRHRGLLAIAGQTEIAPVGDEQRRATRPSRLRRRRGGRRRSPGLLPPGTACRRPRRWRTSRLLAYFSSDSGGRRTAAASKAV